MSTPSTPQISRVRKLPLVWIVPLLALAVGGWMVFHELWDRGPEITIEFANGSGVVAGKTTLDHKGVTVGVAFATPDTAPLALVAEDSTQFTLSAEADKDWFKWAPVIAIQPQDSAPEPARRDAGVPPVLKP